MMPHTARRSRSGSRGKQRTGENPQVDEFVIAADRHEDRLGRPATHQSPAADLSAQSSQQVFPTGALVSHYRIKSVLGCGGMGIVYRARDTVLERDVALKLIRPDRAADRAFRTRLLCEARAASQITHPNVAAVYEVLDLDGLPGIAMELVQGETLRDAIKLRGALALEEILRYGEALAEALAVAHDCGILHRDVNPNNVLIARDGRALLTDFGLARRNPPPDQLASVSTASALNGAGSLAGTPGYLSPDQILNRPVDRRSDIFSFGAVLYEMCTGVRAFPATDPGNLIEATLHREPVAMARLNHQVPAELERIVHKALAKRADERYQNAHDLAADLRALRRWIEAGEPKPAPRHLGRRTVLLAVTALAVVVAALLWRLPGWLQRPDPLPQMTSRQVTSAPGLESEPQISPDGQFIAYASDQSGNQEIWLADLQSGQTLQLTEDPAADRSPAWFPDSGAVAFVSSRGGSNGIWRVARLGGPARLLLEDATDPAIAPDGEQIAFARPDAAGHSRIWIAALAGPTQPRQLTTSATGVWHNRRPAWSPDGRTIAFEDYDDLWVVPAAGGPARRISSAGHYNGMPEWAPDGRHLYFSSFRGDARTLWRIRLKDGTQQRLKLGSESEGRPTLSRDGRRLAYATRTQEAQLLLVDLRSADSTLIPSPKSACFPIVAPDRSKILFTSTQLGNSDLWAVSLAQDRPTGKPYRLTELTAGSGIGTFDPSPDGRYLAYHSEIEGQRDIWIASEGGALINSTDNPAMDIHPAWSPDGTRIVFSSDRDGQYHLWVMPVRDGRPAGPARQLTSGESSDFLPAWSPGGDQLAFIREKKASEAWIMAADGRGQPQPITTGADALRVHWAASGDELFVAGCWADDRVEVRLVRLADSASRSLSPPLVLGDTDSIGDFSLSDDGTLLAAVAERARGDIWLLEASQGHF